MTRVFITFVTQPAIPSVKVAVYQLGQAVIAAALTTAEAVPTLAVVTISDDPVNEPLVHDIVPQTTYRAVTNRPDLRFYGRPTALIHANRGMRWSAAVQLSGAGDENRTRAISLGS